jgi:hypothetical protein
MARGPLLSAGLKYKRMLTCAVCQRAFYRPPSEIRNERPMCSLACAGKRQAERQKGQTPTIAMRAAQRARDARLQEALKFYFGPLTQREVEIFRYAWRVAYQRGWNKQRAGRRRVAA